MNWYKNVVSFTRLAAPYARVRCPYRGKLYPRSCGKWFLADFGEHKIQSGFRRREPGDWKEVSVRNYDRPPAEYDEFSDTFQDISQDTIERGEAVMECPYCHRFMECTYQTDSAKSSGQGSLTSMAEVLDITPIESSLVVQYESVGIVPVMTVQR